MGRIVKPKVENTKYLDRFLFIDSRSNESTKQHIIKKFLLTSSIFEVTYSYDSLQLLK